MAKEIFYRIATPNDAQDMVRVHFNAVQAVSTEFYNKEVLMAWSPAPSVQRVDWLAGIILNANSSCHVATSEVGKIMAFAIYLLEEQSLQALYVDPENSTMGIGSTLINRVEKCAELAGANILYLKASINAVPFYQAMGFDHIQKAQQELSDGSFMQSMLMKKTLG